MNKINNEKAKALIVGGLASVCFAAYACTIMDPGANVCHNYSSSSHYSYTESYKPDQVVTTCPSATDGGCWDYAFSNNGGTSCNGANKAETCAWSCTVTTYEPNGGSSSKTVPHSVTDQQPTPSGSCHEWCLY